MPKDIYYNDDARKRLKDGIDAVANAVKVTLGPMGRTVIIQTPVGHKVTKDGVSVAKEVELEPGTLEALGADVIKEVSLNANHLSGDGTTTATVLAQAIITEGLKSLNSGASPVDIKKGIDKAVSFIVEEIKKNSVQVDETMDSLTQIATISANNDPDIGELIASAYKEMGKDAVISVQKGKGMETSVENIRGYKFKGGYLSKYFVNNEVKMETLYVKPKILVYNGTLKESDIDAIEMLYEAAKCPIAIIVNGLDSGVLESFIVRKLAKKSNIVILKAPYRLERRDKFLEDISAVIGANCLYEEKGHKITNAGLKYLGTCEKLIVDSRSTTIMSGGGSKARIDKRIEDIKSDIEKLKTSYEEKVYLERIAKMTKGISIIKVGALSEIELDEKKDRVDDALRATRAAIEEGYGPGSSLSIIKASKVMPKSSNKDEQIGIDIVKEAVKEPFRQIMINAGLSPDVILSKVLESKSVNTGYNVKTGVYVDMLIEGIIDPTKVSRVALENAASVAGTILTTECALVINKDTHNGSNYFNI